MRLTFIVFKLNFEAGGGACYELDTKVRSLMKFGHMVTVVTLFSPQNKIPAGLPYKIVQEQVKTTHLFDIQKFVCRILRRYQNETDIFQVDGQFGYGSGWYRMTGGKKPVLVHFNRELSSFPESTRKTIIPPPFSLKKKMRFVFENYKEEKKKALKNSEIIRQKYSWDACAVPIIERLKNIYATH